MARHRTATATPAGRSRWSLWSRDSVLSIGSSGSVLSVGSVGSVLSIGSVGSAASVLSIGSAASLGSCLASLSRWSLLSHRGSSTSLGRPVGPVDRAAGLVAVGGLAVGLVARWVVRGSAR